MTLPSLVTGQYHWRKRGMWGSGASELPKSYVWHRWARDEHCSDDKFSSPVGLVVAQLQTRGWDSARLAHFLSIIFKPGFQTQKLAGEAVTKLPSPEARARSPLSRDNVLRKILWLHMERKPSIKPARAMTLKRQQFWYQARTRTFDFANRWAKQVQVAAYWMWVAFGECNTWRTGTNTMKFMDLSQFPNQRFMICSAIQWCT